MPIRNDIIKLSKMMFELGKMTQVSKQDYEKEEKKVKRFEKKVLAEAKLIDQIEEALDAGAEEEEETERVHTPKKIRKSSK